jgi:DMSO/TMAO reductase YedYZ heme-binding membrane subunit
MAYLYYTITAVLLYLLSDWILNKIEQRVGKRLEYRSVVFFVIIMVLALSSFEIIDRIVGEPPQAVEVPKDILPTN